MIKLRNSTSHLAPSATPQTMKRSSYSAMHAMRHIILTVWASTMYHMVTGSAWNAFMKAPMLGQLIPQCCIDMVGNQEPLRNVPRHKSGVLIAVLQVITGMEHGIKSVDECGTPSI